MQISRHWRMNAQRYRLEGIRYQTGDVSLQSRPTIADYTKAEQEPVAPKTRKETVAA